MTRHVVWPAIARTFRRAAAPLAWYYVVTLALPLAHGAANAGAAFAAHALIVLVLPPLLLVLASATSAMTRALLCIRVPRLRGGPYRRHGTCAG